MNKEVRTDETFIKKLYKYMKNGDSIESFCQKFNLNFDELNGVIRLCNLYNLQVEIVKYRDTYVFKKSNPKLANVTKPSIYDEKLNNFQICMISDTHYGSIHQQLHLVNYIYEECYKRGIQIVLHCGDIVDGNYPNRPENPRQQFLHGYDEQANYVVDMHPMVDGIKTYYILGSHDESHYKNGQATINNMISRTRDDMIYLGQDMGAIQINKVNIMLDHPGGGSSQALSYKPQKRIELLESGYKPHIIGIGHYHKSYFFNYRGIVCVETPALCDKTQFQYKQGLLNCVGAYFLDIYADSKGNIIYCEPEEIAFTPKDMWDEAGKDRKKVKKLVIN